MDCKVQVVLNVCPEAQSSTEEQRSTQMIGLQQPANDVTTCTTLETAASGQTPHVKIGPRTLKSSRPLITEGTNITEPC